MSSPNLRPPAGGFGMPPPAGVGPFGPFPAQRSPAPPRASGSLLSALRRFHRVSFFVVGLPLLVLVACVIIKYESEKKNDLVAFDNRLSDPADIIVDGKLVKTIAPHEHSGWVFLKVVSLPKGAKKIVVTAKGQKISEATLDIRPRADDEPHGYRGLYVIGPSSEYVIASISYYAKTPKTPEQPKLVRIPEPSPLAELPRELESFEIGSVDAPFVRTESMPRGTEMVWMTRLCTFDRSKPDAIGCSGFADDDDR